VAIGGGQSDAGHENHANPPRGKAERRRRPRAHAGRDAEPGGADSDGLDARERPCRPVCAERRGSATAAWEAREPVRFGIAKLRPKQTLAPLAAALGLPIITFLKGQEAELVAAAKAAEGPALICWQHEAIPEIATLILGRADGVVPVWPGHRFDLVWVFDLQGDGTWSFVQAPELLLPGDSARPIT